MVLSVGANKKRILAVLVLTALVIGAFFLIPRESEPVSYPGLAHEERIGFLQSFGWTVKEEPADVREIVIPAVFSDVYTAYNEMQKAQGFDLKPYAGEKCTQFRYIITNYPECTETVFATLLVYEGKIIGGDVAVETADGFMHGFAPGSAAYQMPESAA